MIYFIKQLLDLQKDPTVCYFGDHLRNDVTLPKTAVRWKTVAIVEELDDLEVEQKWTCDFDASPITSPTNVNHPSSNMYWGSFFFTKQKTPTYWAWEMIQNSDLVVPSLDRLASLPLDAEHTFEQIQSKITVNIKTLLLQK